MDWFTQISKYIDNFFASMGGLSKQHLDMIGIAVIVSGALFAYLGFRFFKYLLGLAGFLAGSIIGMTLFHYVPFLNTSGEIGQLVVAAIIGAFGAAIFYFIFYYFGIFVFGAVSAMWLGMIFLPRFPEYSQYRLLFILGLGFVGGLLAFLLRKMLIIVLTSAIGAVLVVFGLGHFYNWPVSVSNFSFSDTFNGAFIDTLYYHSDGVIIIALTILFLVSGLVVQIYTSKGKVYEHPRRRD